eukprot:sb/3467233/
MHYTILLSLLLSFFLSIDGGVLAITGFYQYQVAQVGDAVTLHCTSSGQSIGWYRVLPGDKEGEKKRENLRAPDYEISTTNRCGNPQHCDSFEVNDPGICLRSTIVVRSANEWDSGHYYCYEQSGTDRNPSYAYVLQVFKELSPPHIYEFVPKTCNSTLWYLCITSPHVNRYEFYISHDEQLYSLSGSQNSSKIAGTDVQFVTRHNSITLYDYSILKMSNVKFGCRAYGSSGAFRDYKASKISDGEHDFESPDEKREQFQNYLLRLIAIGVGGLTGLILLLFIMYKVSRRIRRSRHSSSPPPTGM